MSKLAQVELGQKAMKADLASAPPEVATSAASFSSMFAAIGRGKQVALADAENATLEVMTGIKKNGLNAWLDDVRRYHEGTFQHCLLVTRVAVAFAMDIKFSEADVMRLGLAATLHDVGKARIPLAILDKPGRLDQNEQEIMNRHPVIGHELLKAIPDIGPEILGWGQAPPRISRWLRLSGRADGAGDFRPGAVADDLRHLRRADRMAAVPAVDAPARRLQDPVRHGRKTGSERW